MKSISVLADAQHNLAHKIQSPCLGPMRCDGGREYRFLPFHKPVARPVQHVHTGFRDERKRKDEQSKGKRDERLGRSRLW
jgi:hypothetical protein